MFADDIKNALEVLKAGGLILYPTDTVWGIGCDATNTNAVRKLFDLKERNRSKQMLVLTDSASRITGYVNQMPDLAWDLIELSAKPLTIIYSGAKNLASELISPDGSIAIRVTSEAFSKTLCSRFRKPIVSTSANKSGEETPLLFSEICENIKQSVDYVVVYRQGETQKHNPSGIIRLGLRGEIEIIRE
ncbi:MAG: threonylcarbamoyl-AMP synthase [Bacteroidales bacterium]|jgi:L-threonylcarbamoyladenylate synthase|nr:threonylcarbamoyl-AMP synthase [Bacteroidales bacterium]